MALYIFVLIVGIAVGAAGVFFLRKPVEDKVHSILDKK